MRVDGKPLTIAEGYRPGIVGRCLELQARYYAARAGFDHIFEAGRAADLSAFFSRDWRGRSQIWSVLEEDTILGTIAVDGDLGPNLAQLRWFIVDDRARGTGVGRKLLGNAMRFCDEISFAETHLWTFARLDAARHLYGQVGFVLMDETKSTEWGPAVLKQRFVRRAQTEARGVLPRPRQTACSPLSPAWSAREPTDMNDDILFAVDDGIARITFNRPAQRNAFTFAMYERLAELCAQIDADDSIRVAVLTGAGAKAFAAGTDIAAFERVRTAEDGLAYEARIDRVLGTLERCRVPTIAAIAGACTGGGAAIAACCDLRIATADLRFGFPIARTLGNCLSISNYARLYALLGPARTKDLIFTARLIGAAEAQALGLVSEVVADQTALIARANEFAQTVAGHAPLTLRATKEALRRITAALAPDGADLIGLCYASDDFREGRAAFLEKRSPRWNGR